MLSRLLKEIWAVLLSEAGKRTSIPTHHLNRRLSPSRSSVFSAGSTAARSMPTRVANTMTVNPIAAVLLAVWLIGAYDLFT
jgi:beta-lactamase regulating signal transducer with metallopeptidase domain